VPDFLDEKRDEIDDRLAELKPLVDEYNRLRAASAALAGVDGGTRADVPESSTPASALTSHEQAGGAAEPAAKAEPAAGAESAGRAAFADSLALSGGVESAERPELVDKPAPAGRSPLAPALSRPGDFAARPTRRAGRPKGSGTRSAEALRIVREQPGVTIPELADRMGIKQNYLYRVLPELVQEGKVAKQGRGWHPRAGGG